MLRPEVSTPVTGIPDFDNCGENHMGLLRVNKQSLYLHNNMQEDWQDAD